MQGSPQAIASITDLDKPSWIELKIKISDSYNNVIMSVRYPKK
jgi:hypothetical protein